MAPMVPILNRVKQGCVLAPTLFTIFFNMMLQRATEDLSDDDGIYIRYRTDGSQFILRHLQAHTKTLEYLVQELLFADDAALVAHTENALQRVTSCFAEAAQLFSLEVSWRRQRFFISPPPRKRTAYPTSQLARQNWRQSSSSPTSGAPSRQAQKSTKRWITDWQSQTVLSFRRTLQSCLEQQALEESHKNQHLRTEPWYCLPSCTAPRRGSHTVITCQS